MIFTLDSDNEDEIDGRQELKTTNLAVLNSCTNYTQAGCEERRFARTIINTQLSSQDKPHHEQI
jgi:hypothetical protein